MLIPSKFSGYHNGTRQLHISSGGGGGGTTQTTSTVQNTNIPEYARGYVENMLGATQEQLFQGYRTPTSYDPNTGQTTGGEFNITGFKPYQAYGGTYDAQGNQLSYDPSKGIAGFSPMQVAAQQGISNLTLPQEMRDASEATKLAFHDARRLGQGYQASTYGNQFNAPGAYQAGTFGGQQVNAPALDSIQMGGVQGLNAAYAGNTRLDAAPTYKGQQLGYTPRDIGYQQVGAERVQAMPLDKYQMQAARDVSTGSFTQPGTANQYMSPYMQSVVNTQQREAQRQADIAAQSRGAAAARSGAFGGSRQAIENAEAARNLAMQKGDIQTQGLQSAFQQAQQQYNTEQQAALQAALANQQTQQQTGVQNLSALLQTQGLAAQTGLTAQTSNQQAALQAALANQAAGIDTSKFNQMQQYNTALQNAQLAQQQQLANQSLQGQYGLQQGQMNQAINLANQASQNQAAAQNQQMAYNVGQQNLAARLGIQQLGASQNMQASLANQQNQLAAQQAYEQSRQFGAGQGLNAAQLSAQYGLAGQQLSEQAKQFGGQYGLQANAQALGAANQYGALGNQMLQAQQGIYGLQNQVGGQQQAYQQSILNQAIQDYANAQQYPLMQLGTMSNMLRGLPMQASTTNQYAASPNPLSQAVGTIGAGASIYNAFNPTGRGASGGLPKEFKFAKGGITSVPGYDMGGEVESQLENMGEEQLAKQAKESSSPSIRKMAQRILRERQMGNKPQGTGPMGVQYQAAQPQTPSYAPGGIVAFQQGGGGNGVKSAIDEGGEDEAKIDMEKRLAMPPSTTPPPGGIMGVTTPPVTPVPTAPQAGRAMQQAPDIPAFMKAEYADAERRMNAPLSDFMAERKAAMQEAGVADASEGQQKLRAELMAEKANMGEERERQKNLRMAEFFASWGSTPGPVLVAGLNALQKTVPNIISDEKEQKKARREIDKSIADLDNATRLEKRGEVDAAMALKLKAAEDMKALNMKFIDYQSRRESDASAAAASKYTADAHLRAEEIRANTARLDRTARRETEDDNKRFGQYQAAAQQEQRLIAKITDQAKLLEKDYETIKTAEMNAKQNEGKMAPAFVPGYEAAKKKIAEQEAIWNKQKEQAARDTNLAYERVRIMPQAAKDYTKPSTAAPAAGAPSAGPVSGEFSAPTEAHINALKANPQQAAAFDAKFGPGAANEYLGK